VALRYVRPGVNGSADRDEVLQIVVRVLGPYVGANMARASAKGHMDKLGVNRRVSPAAAEELLALLRPALAVFVGREKTDSVLAELREALRQTGEARGGGPP
jgi:hypothetical protein